MALESSDLGLMGGSRSILFDHIQALLQIVLTAHLASHRECSYLSVEESFNFLISLLGILSLYDSSRRCFNSPERQGILDEFILLPLVILCLSRLHLLFPVFPILLLEFLLVSLRLLLLLVVLFNLIVELDPLFD